MARSIRHMPTPPKDESGEAPKTERAAIVGGTGVVAAPTERPVSA